VFATGLAPSAFEFARAVTALDAVGLLAGVLLIVTGRRFLRS
jgi:hypothetical protein